VGQSVTFTVTTDPPGWYYCVSWSGGGNPATQSGGQTFDTSWDSSGTKTVTASCCCGGTSSKSKQVKVIGVSSVSEDKTKACVNEDITFTANPSPSGPLDCINWEKRYKPDIASAWGSWTSVTGGDPDAVLNTSTAGYYQYRARNGSDDTWKESSQVSIVTVDKLQYNDPDTGYTDISGTLYVHTGTTVTFKAIKKPLDASWPSGKPVWGGTSGASGTGETKEVTFSTLSSSTSDYKTVTATCCNDTVTANVIVFEFEGIFCPYDNFDGRTQESYGLEEMVELTFNTDPPGITAYQTGGLTWDWVGVGDLSSYIGTGTASYDAEHIADTVAFSLIIDSGPSKDHFQIYLKSVIEPSGTRMTRVNPNNVWHTQGIASAGIKLYYWLDPKTVSFSNLEFGEDACNTTNDAGCWLGFQGHAQNTFGSILGGDSTTGCRVNLPDYAWAAIASWGNGGTFTWNIPTQYIDDTSTRNTFGSTQSQVHTTQASGDATQAKGGQSGTAALNDPTSGF